MKKLSYVLSLVLVILTLLLNKVAGQSFIEFSKYHGSTGNDNAIKMQVVNGETFIVGSTAYTGWSVRKYSATGTELYSTPVGNSGYIIGMKVINGEVFLKGDGFFSIIITKLNANGSIDFQRSFGSGSQMHPLYDGNIEIVGNEIFFGGTVEGNNYPITIGPMPAGGGLRAFITKINAIDGSLIASMYPSGTNYSVLNSMIVKDGAIYLISATDSINLPITIGNYPTGGYHIYIKKLNSSNFNTIYSRYIGETATVSIQAAEVVNGDLHFTGYAYSDGYPVTNGSTISATTDDDTDGFYTRLNADASIGFSTYLSTDEDDNLSGIHVSDGGVYLTGIIFNLQNYPNRKILVRKINSDGSFGFNKKINYYSESNIYPNFEVVNGELYIAGIGAEADFPVTNGSQFYDQSTGFFTHLDPAGNTVFATFLGKMTTMLPMKIENGKVYIFGNTNVAAYPVTDNSIISGNKDNILIVLNPDGTNFFSGFIGGAGEEKLADMAIDGNAIYLSGNTFSANYPVTNTVLYQGGGDEFLTKLSFCPGKYYLESDTLLPKTQTVCKYGFTEIITGNIITVPADSLPILYLNGISTLQHSIEITTYQWQTAFSPTGPWTNIPAATSKNYRPIIGGVNQYYRRLAFSPAECGAAVIHTSDTASVLINSFTAPTIQAGGPFTTCPGSAITIGGTPTVTGGNPPYNSYAWDMGAAAVANPVVSPGTNTIYTLIVTDAQGCKQIGQAVVLTYKADAGPDKSNCAGAPVKIGQVPIAGVPGVLYNWLPATNLTSTIIAQPFANPLSQTDYELTLTVPKSGGGTCITKDTVRVTPVTAPATMNIAGPDKVICIQDSSTIGTTPEPGFSYLWSPATYLVSNNLSAATFYSVDQDMPTPNPATINLSAQKNGCIFTDQVIIATIESRAGTSGCGPRIVGSPDRTPNINETYSWTKISGPGNFTGVTNLPQVPVSASVGGTTIYSLTVSYNGGSCTSQVSVPESCDNNGGCSVGIIVDAKYHCPGYTVNNGNVRLNASSSIANALFTWSPQSGLSAYSGNSVLLTDNIPRTYTVTATDAIDSSVYCIGQISTNNPAFSIPVFDAPDTATCAGIPVMIGLPAATGYAYSWTGFGLSNNSISDPIATINYPAQYVVNVTNGTGCSLNDSVYVQVQNAAVNAGPDWIICSSGTINLGTTGQPNTTYLWEPQASPWQNGTNQFSPQPEVLAAAAVTYTVTATTSAGCITTDQVNVTVNNSPTLPNAPDKVICKGSNGVIGLPALPGATYQWIPSTGLNNTNIAQPIANPAATTTYTVLVTLQGSCALPATDQVTVTVSNAAFDLPDIHFCPSGGVFPLGVGAPAGMSQYYWTPPQSVSNNLIANPNIVLPLPTVPTMFTLRVRNADNCNYTDTINIIPETAAPIAGTDMAACKDQPVVIGSAANPTGPSISYNWTPVTYLNNASSPNPVFTGTTVGTFQYILTKTDNSISCTSKDTIVINVVDLLAGISSPTICRNSCVQIGTDPLAGIQYQWSPVTGLSNPAIANPIACIDTMSTTYTVTAIDLDGCTTSANVVIGVNAMPGLQVSIPNITACVGDNTVMFNPTIPPGSYSYQWSPDDGTLSNINILNPTISSTSAGNTQYILQITDNTTGCTNTATANLVVNNCPTFATAGNFVWIDTNSNGLQDATEAGMGGITVRLYNTIGYNVATTVTDANGTYYFVNIPPGNNYYIIFEPPVSYLFTLQNVGGASASNNSKANINGRTNNFDLLTGGTINNMDAGIIPDGPVPVSLLSFTASLQNRKTLLNWQTTAEYNNHYFDIERSNNGINFNIIGKVLGNGTTALPHNYSLIDPNPLTGINYYRLNQVDFDGHNKYSPIETVELKDNNTISAWYSNLDNSIHISFNKQQVNTQLKLFGANGQLIKTAVTTNNILAYTLDLPVLATGIYILQVINDKFSYSKKLFIMK